MSYQFYSLPTISQVEQPAVLLNITAQGFILIPQMFLHIVSGNEEKLFDTLVEGDTGKKSTIQFYQSKLAIYQVA